MAYTINVIKNSLLYIVSFNFSNDFSLSSKRLILVISICVRCVSALVGIASDDYFT